MRLLKFEFIKKLDGKFILMNSNETGFSSKHLAAKELKLSHKTISKFLNTHKDYNLVALNQDHKVLQHILIMKRLKLLSDQGKTIQYWLV